MAEALTDALETVEGDTPIQEAVAEQVKEDFLNNLVGEDKKYKSANDLAKEASVLIILSVSTDINSVW